MNKKWAWSKKDQEFLKNHEEELNKLQKRIDEAQKDIKEHEEYIDDLRAEIESFERAKIRGR